MHFVQAHQFQFVFDVLEVVVLVPEAGLLLRVVALGRLERFEDLQHFNSHPITVAAGRNLSHSHTQFDSFTIHHRIKDELNSDC